MSKKIKYFIQGDIIEQTAKSCILMSCECFFPLQPFGLTKKYFFLLFYLSSVCRIEVSNHRFT